MSRHTNLPNIAELLFDLSNGLEIGCSVEGISAQEEELDKVSRHVTASNVETLCQMRKSMPVVDWNNVSATVSRIDDYTG